MLNKDFNAEYDVYFKERCPAGERMKNKIRDCCKKSEAGDLEPGNKTCRKCWHDYINQQEPENCKECEGKGHFRPCSHTGCYSHVTHPCEMCGRMQGRCNTCGGSGKAPADTGEQGELFTGGEG